MMMFSKLIVLFSLVSLNLFARTISIEEVAMQISKNNFLVLENANRTYQAAEQVQAARMSLLPSLNLWNVVEAVISPASMIGMIQDIAPFLVPANWFRKNEKKYLYKIELLGYQTVWANQIQQAKALYLKTLNDFAFADALAVHLTSLQKIYEMARDQELLGGASQNISNAIYARILALKNDQSSFEVIKNEELGQIKYLLGMPNEEELVIRNINPELRKLNHNYDLYLQITKETSTEIHQYEELLNVVPLVKKEIQFSFLGTSSITRGAAGGIFDDLPMQPGLGFASGANIKNLKNKKKLLELQKEGITALISMNLKNCIDQLLLDYKSFELSKNRLKLNSSIKEEYLTRMLLGDLITPIELMESEQNILASQLLIKSIFYRIKINEDKLDRFLHNADYANAPNPL